MGKIKTLEILDPTLKQGFAPVPLQVLRSPRLSPSSKTLYALLLSYAWFDAECFPGQERLAQDFGATRQTIKKYLDELKDAQLIDWEQRGFNKTNLYKILPIPHNFELDVNALLHPDVNAALHKVNEVEINKNNDLVRETKFSHFNYKGYSLKYEGERVDILSSESGDTSTLIEETILSGVNTYLETYHQRHEAPHPNLSSSQWETVLDTFTGFVSETGYGLEVEDWEHLTHFILFENNYKKPTDHNLNWIASNPQLLKTAYYKKCYYS